MYAVHSFDTGKRTVWRNHSCPWWVDVNFWPQLYLWTFRAAASFCLHSKLRDLLLSAGNQISPKRFTFSFIATWNDENLCSAKTNAQQLCSHVYCLHAETWEPAAAVCVSCWPCCRTAELLHVRETHSVCAQTRTGVCGTNRWSSWFTWMEVFFTEVAPTKSLCTHTACAVT